MQHLPPVKKLSFNDLISRLPMPAIIAQGDANPSAHGHAAASIAIMRWLAVLTLPMKGISGSRLR